MPDGPATYDTRFSLPACDDPASTEAGVVVLGLPAEQLLAGLGMAALADDPASVAMLVDQARHYGGVSITADSLVAVGLDRWRSVQPALEAMGARDQRTTPLRHAWERAFGSLSRCEIGAVSPAAAVFLTACWLRAAEISGYRAPAD